jgi:ribose transport system substrate-binding protein
MEAMLQANKKIDIVYGHNDPAAEGAYIAAKNAGREKEMKFIGIDALPTPDGGIKSVMDGRISATYVYPTGGKDAIESAYKLLVKGEKLEKNVTLDTIEVTKDTAADVYKQFGGK